MNVLRVKTNKPKELIDITKEVEQFASSQNNVGLVTVFAKHTTCAIVITEFEPGIEGDILSYLDSISPKGPFGHNHGGAAHPPSHIFSALISQSRSIPVQNGQLQLGIWQRICLLELDGPREREIVINVV